MLNKLLVSMEPGLGKARDSFIYLCIKKTFTGIVVLYVRRNSEFIEELWAVVGGVQLEEFREGHGATEVEVRDVHSAEKGALGDRRVQNALHCGEISSGGSDGVGYLYTVSAGGAANATDNGILYPFLTGYLVIVGRGFGGLHAGGEGTGNPYELNQLLAAQMQPLVPIGARETSIPFEGAAVMVQA